MRRTFQSGNRFWNIERKGRKVVTSWGTVGGKETSRSKGYSSDAPAEAAFYEAASAKVRAGYRETTFRGDLPLSDPVAQGLIAALVENPDDLSAHMAFADWLSEQRDDRLTAWGEFIRLQLSSEGAAKKGGRKTAEQKRTEQLQDEYEIHWLGEDLAQALLPLGRRSWGGPAWREYKRGWLTRLQYRYLDGAEAGVLARAPALRLLQELDLGGFTHEGDLAALSKGDCLANVRRLTVNSWRSASGLVPLVRKMPRLESLALIAFDLKTDELFSLPTLSSLRTLEVVGPARYATQKLAANPALRRLRRLSLNAVSGQDYYDGQANSIGPQDVATICHAAHFAELTELVLRQADLGADGCRAIAESGILARLELLDLSACGLTDAQAEVLAASADFPRVKEVQLGGNYLTPGMARRLRRLNKGVSAPYQRNPFDDEAEYDEDWE